MRIAKIILQYLTVLLLAITTLVLIAFHVLQRDLSNLVLSTLEPYIQADVKVQSIKATLFDAFPQGSVELVNVRISDTDSSSNNYAYEIGRVYLMFDYKDLLSGNIRVRHIILRDATIKMVYNSDGSSNFEFWKVNDSTSSDTADLKLDLDKVELYNTKYSFINFQDDFKLVTQINHGHFSLHTIGQDTHMDIEADFEINDIQDGEIHWLERKTLKSKLGFSILDLDKYTIQGGDLLIENMKFKIDGTIDNSSPSLYTDIVLKSEHSRLEELIKISPGLLNGSLDDYEIEGAAWFNTSIKGNWSATESAKIDVGFGFRDGSIFQKSSELKLQSLNLDGHYSNGTKQTNASSYIQLKGLSAKHNTGSVTGDFYLSNFDQPFCKFDLKGDLDLAWLNNMFSFEEVEHLEGKVEADLHFDGLLSNLDETNSLSKVEIGGDLTLKDIEIELKDLPTAFEHVNGKLSFEKPYLMVNDFSLTYGSSDVGIEGYFKNPLTFLNDKSLLLYGDLTCDTLNFDELLALDEPEEEGEIEEPFEWPGYLFANLNSTIGFVKYEDFEVTDISGTTKYSLRKLFLKNVGFNGIGGHFNIDGLVKANTFTGYSVDADVVLDSIDITELFSVFGNFDQDAITSDNLKGRLSTESTIAFKMNDNFDVDLNTLSMNSLVTIIDGELIDFMPMVKMAGFIKVGNFQHIIFDTLKNEIFIQGDLITIPETEVHSNTFDMTISGTHTFENICDYRMAVNLKKLFMEENAITDRSFNFYAIEPKGGITVYLTVKGPADDPSITYDTDALGGKIGKGISQQAKELIEAKEKEKLYNNSRRDSLMKVHRSAQKLRRRNSLKEGWEGLRNK